MNRFVIAIMSFLCGAAVAFGQYPTKLHTKPTAPPWDVLRRLDLHKAFHIRLKMEGLRDGISSIEVIPNKNYPQVLVQTFYGRVALIDGENGDIFWQTAVGLPYRNGAPPTYNTHSIMTNREDKLFVLSRTTGLQRVYLIDPRSKVRTYGFDMALPAGAKPVADDQIIYFVAAHRVTAYAMPDFQLVDSIAEQSKKKGTTNTPDPVKLAEQLQPSFLWGYSAPEEKFTQPALITDGQLGVIGNNGRFLSLNRFESLLRLSFKTVGNVAADMGQHQQMAYIPSEDFNLYALNMINTELTWRFGGQAPITRKPTVTDDVVFVTPEKRGIFCLDRDTGREKWHQPRAVRVVAVNKRFVYAMDNRRQLLVLSYERGTLLARYSMYKWVVPVTNELSDRLYFASHDGQILCLRHRTIRTPIEIKTIKKGAAKKVDIQKLRKKINPFQSRRFGPDTGRRLATMQFPLGSRMRRSSCVARRSLMLVSAA